MYHYILGPKIPIDDPSAVEGCRWADGGGTTVRGGGYQRRHCTRSVTQPDGMLESLDGYARTIGPGENWCIDSDDG